MSVGSVSIRTRMADEVTYIDMRVSHPMENGSRKDAAGVVIPSWYLTNMDLYHNDVRVGALELGPLVSRNPAISVVLNGGVEGDLVKVTWIDNRGEIGERSVKLS